MTRADSAIPHRRPQTPWRTLVGDYRIVAAIEDDRFVVVTGSYRREVYR
jgi:hypothetical protein